MNKTILIAVAAALAAVLARAVPAVPDHPDGLLDMKGALAAAAKATADAYPDADTVDVDSVQRTWYAPDGTSVMWYDGCSKILTEKGRREAASLRMGFHEFYGTVEVKRVEIHKPDGRTVPVDVAALSRVTVASDQMASNIYDPKYKMLSVGIPNLETGDVLRVVIRDTQFRVRIPDQWADYTTFENRSPILRAVYEVHAPAARPLRHRVLKSEVPGTMTYTNEVRDGVTLHRWTARNVPQMFPEPDMPDPRTVTQRLLLSTSEDWASISKWYWEICLPHMEKTTPAMKAAVADLTKDCKDDRARIEALFAFVSQKIRYMGITTETEAPGYEPHDVNITFENRHGVCRDKAALLAAMFRLAGIDGFPVIIHVGSKRDEEVPLPYFNHAITAARLKDGTLILMDPTDEATRELLPAYLGNRSFLVATPAGDPLRTSPVPPAEENLVRIETQAELGADRVLRGRVAAHFDGVNDNAYRGYFARLKPDERSRFFESVAKRAVAGARLTSLEIEPADMQDRDRPLVARFGFEAPDPVVRGGSAALVNPPGFGNALGVVHSVLDSTGLEKRKYPLVTTYACGIRETFSLRTGDSLGAAKSAPEFAPLDTETLRWAPQWTFRNGVLEGRSEMLLKVVEFSPDQYAALKSALRSIEVDRRKRAVMEDRGSAGAAPAAVAAKPAAPEADSEILEAVTDCVLDAAGNATTTNSVRKRILTYAGVKANAEVKIDHLPVWDEVAIPVARVTAPDGAVKTLSAEETNLMDQPWTGSAPRYPPGRTLVASLPGVVQGAVVETTVVQTSKDRPFFSAAWSFGGFNPVQRRVVRLRAPASLALKVLDRTAGAVRFTETREGDAIVRTWTATNLPALSRESAMPPDWAQLPTVFVSSGDWAAYARALRAALDAAATGQSAAAAKARELTAACTNKAQAARAIRDFVDQSVRGAGPGLADLPLAAIAPADVTLRDGYGNGADQAVLLHAMLTAAGFQPSFVVASGHDARMRIHDLLIAAPQRRLFGSVLVSVDDGTGTAVLLNDTDHYTDLGASPHLRHDALDLAAGRVAALPAPGGFESRTETALALDVAPDGSALLRLRRTHYGMNNAAWRKHFSELPPEERRRYHQEQVAGISQNAVAEGPLVTRFEGHPGLEEFAVRIDRYAVRDGDRLYFILPVSPVSLPGLTSDARANPLYWGGSSRDRVEVDVRLPEGFGQIEIAPPDLAWTNDGAGRIAMETKRGADGSLRITRTIDLEPVLFPATNYPALLELDRDLKHPRLRTVMVKRESSP